MIMYLYNDNSTELPQWGLNQWPVMQMLKPLGKTAGQVGSGSLNDRSPLRSTVTYQYFLLTLLKLNNPCVL